MSRTRMKAGRLGTYGLLAALALTLGSVAPANAIVSVAIGGDSNFRVTATATTSHASTTKATRVSGTASVKFTANVLGLPIHAYGKAYNSFPTIFKAPRLDAWDVTLKKTSYTKKVDPWLGATQWVAEGEKSFWGEASAKIKGSATGSSSGSKFFHAGTGTGNPVNANAAVRITLK